MNRELTRQQFNKLILMYAVYLSKLEDLEQEMLESGHPLTLQEINILEHLSRKNMLMDVKSLEFTDMEVKLAYNELKRDLILKGKGRIMI